MNFTHRYVAQIVVEALTPLAIGSDSLAYDQDSPVDKDFNGLPYIPGTAIAGYLKKQLTDLQDLFGKESDSKNNQPKGSNIIISEAFLMNEKGKVSQQPETISSNFLKRYFNLPIRQHTAINEFGAAKEHSKFDTEIVYKGSRFKFEIELQVEEKNDKVWHTILNAFFQNNFYLGAGEFNNFGELKVIELKEKHFDLSNKNDLKLYLEHDVDLNTINNEIFKLYSPGLNEKYNTQTIELSGKNSFFHFGSGYGDTEVDNTNYTEFVIEGWDNDEPEFVEKFVIPGTSIKGALSHRVAYHFNKKEGNFVEKLLPELQKTIETDFDKKYNFSNFKLADNLDDLEKQKSQLEEQLAALEKDEINTAILFDKYVGSNNEGVKDLFGLAKKSATDTGKSGNVIIKDIYLSIDTPQTIFMHNKIDRYTGGTIEGALFSEKVLAIDKVTLCIKYKNGFDKTYLDKALDDLKKGMLPIGGLVNKGHGIFVEIKDKENGK